MVPFQLHYTLTRRQRLAVELYPWLPCLAACLGFTMGVSFLAVNVSVWFLILLALPPLVARKFFVFLVELTVQPSKPVDVLVEDGRLGILVDGERRWLSLAGIIQVYRSGDHRTWTVLHYNGSVVTIPEAAVNAEQVDYLKGFALRAAAARRATAAQESLHAG